MGIARCGLHKSGLRLASAAWLIVSPIASLIACSDDRGARDADSARAGRIAEVEAPIARDRARVATGETPAMTGEAAAAGLARAAGGATGATYTVRALTTVGAIEGHVTGGAPRDTSIVPTHDLGTCEPFTQSLVPSTQGGAGNALVWLEGVSAGPRDTTPKRVTMTLDGCRLAPRLLLLGQGGTLIVHGRDAMLSRLQFTRAGSRASVATVLLSDAGQVVPVSELGRAPGLIAVHDDRHPWVRGWIAVTPHPYVAITRADGRFRFDGVPPGRYRLIVWHERLGTRATPVRIESAITARVELKF